MKSSIAAAQRIFMIHIKAHKTWSNRNLNLDYFSHHICTYRLISDWLPVGLLLYMLYAGGFIYYCSSIAPSTYIDIKCIKIESNYFICTCIYVHFNRNWFWHTNTHPPKIQYLLLVAFTGLIAFFFVIKGCICFSSALSNISCNQSQLDSNG